MKKLGYLEGLWRLIVKYKESLEDTVLAVLKVEIELKCILCNVVWKLRVRLETIKSKAEKDAFINKMKKKIIMNETNAKNCAAECNTGSKYYLVYDNVLMYILRVAIPVVLQNKMLKEFNVGHF